MKKLTILTSLIILLSCEGDDFKGVACFTASAENVTINQEISFTNCSTNAESYLWCFGDGEVSTEVNPRHIFTVAGVYKVKLYANANEMRDQNGDMIIDEMDIVIPHDLAELFITVTEN